MLGKGERRAGRRSLGRAAHHPARARRASRFGAVVLTWLVVAGTHTTAAAAFAGAAADSPRPPALAAAADSKTSCIYVGSGSFAEIQPSLARVEGAAHFTYSCLQLFATSDSTWKAWSDPWFAEPQYGWSRWLRRSPSTHTIILTIQLIPDAVATSSNNANPERWEAPCARGAYDRYAAALGRDLVANGFSYAIVRLGSEASGTWENDWVGATALEESDWARCFAREVTAMRSAPGEHFLFDWTLSPCYYYLPFSSYYPGNAYVDIVGVDQYDQSCDRKLPGASARRWQDIAADLDGIDTVALFAAAHQKPVSLPEWGLLKTGAGDDPFYVEGIGAFVRNNDVSYQCYFDASNADVLPLGQSIPHSMSAYRRFFAR